MAIKKLVKAKAKAKAVKAAPKKSVAAKTAVKKAVGAKQWVYLFSDVKGVTKAAASWSEIRDLLGGKGAGLFDMTRNGFPVPSGFTLTTEVCKDFVKAGNAIPTAAWKQTLEAMKAVEKATGKTFGGVKGSKVLPLLVSARSGARESMPGMMETVLNVGLNDVTVEQVATISGNARFAYDSYRRLLMMYGATVLGIDDEKFDEPMDHIKHERGVKLDTELTTDDLKQLVEVFKGVIKAATGEDSPQNVYDQLKGCAMAVFRSATGHKAKEYAKAMGWKETLPTAVNIVQMVFGNMGDDCATGVAFTRNPSTGDKLMLGEYLINAQGEDVVAGIRTPKPIVEMGVEMPAAYSSSMSLTVTCGRSANMIAARSAPWRIASARPAATAALRP